MKIDAKRMSWKEPKPWSVAFYKRYQYLAAGQVKYKSQSQWQQRHEISIVNQ